MKRHSSRHTISILLNSRTYSPSLSIIVAATILMLLSVAGHAGTRHSSVHDKIVLERVSSAASGGYGYKLQYYVAAPIEAFWIFKTDFDSDILLTSDELIGHRLVRTEGNSIITENRYATAPGIRFLWQTTVIPEQYRLEFKLLNAEDCRHDFHHGTIQLNPAGSYTKVTQIAFFNFAGASLWVKYPWYGGMKSTLTKVAKWEQTAVSMHSRKLLVAANK
ncbi:MAG: hypothetical protein PVG08_19450 [Desulfobacterales bacterium]|jgi:hypothetical protein